MYMGSCFSLFGVIYGAFNLKETLKTKDRKSTHQYPDEERSFRAGHGFRTSSTGSSSSTTLPVQKTNTSQESTTLLEQASGTEAPSPDAAPPRWEIFTPLVCKVLLTNLTFSLAFSISEEVYAVWAASDISYGGLGFNERMIGFSLAIIGFAVVCLQLFIYPNLERRRGSLWCYRRGLALLTPYHVLVPFLSILASKAQTHVNKLVTINEAEFDTQSPAYIALWTCLICVSADTAHNRHCVLLHKYQHHLDQRRAIHNFSWQA